MSKAHKPKRRVRLNAWGNWKGYEGTRMVYDFGTNAAGAESWAAGSPLPTYDHEVYARKIGRPAPKVGEIFRVSVSKHGTQIGRVTAVKGSTVSLRRLTTDGDEFWTQTATTDTMHVILANVGDLRQQLEMDNFYGMLVPFGTKKKHVCNHNV